MKFGKLDHIQDVSFDLPNDHSVTTQLLSGAPRVSRILMGGTMWNIPQWVGKIYPLKTAKKNFITAYGDQFSTIELNATHYRLPTKETVRTWASSVREDFVFCPKFPQSISHYRRFQHCENITDEFLENILEFGEKLSVSFIQLPPHFSSEKAGQLIAFLTSLPRDMRFALEFRHPSWFDGNPAAEETWDAMRSLGISSIISDTAGRRDAVHMRLTTPHCIVRFGGNDLDPTDEVRLRDWVKRLKKWQAQGLHEFQLWMHQPESLNTPETCQLFARLVKEELGQDLFAPRLLHQQTSLF
ncbi:MAG: DUF72 domain-containing protein [Flavobacteriales bacterium]